MNVFIHILQSLREDCSGHRQGEVQRPLVAVPFNALVQKLSGDKDTKIGIAWVLHSTDVSFWHDPMLNDSRCLLVEIELQQQSLWP
jgi:hypothetical protein